MARINWEDWRERQKQWWGPGPRTQWVRDRERSWARADIATYAELLASQNKQTKAMNRSHRIRPNAEYCGVCGARAVLRRGAHVWYLGCENFPECLGAASVSSNRRRTTGCWGPWANKFEWERRPDLIDFYHDEDGSAEDLYLKLPGGQAPADGAGPSRDQTQS